MERVGFKVLLQAILFKILHTIILSDKENCGVYLFDKTALMSYLGNLKA